MIDASAAVLGLLQEGDARRRLSTETMITPHLADLEVANALRGQVLRGVIGAGDARSALSRWARLGLRRYAAVGLLDRIWELRENLSAYDAAYVALSETFDCNLVTADVRLARAPGVFCAVDVVRS